MEALEKPLLQQLVGQEHVERCVGGCSGRPGYGRGYSWCHSCLLPLCLPPSPRTPTRPSLTTFANAINAPPFAPTLMLEKSQGTNPLSTMGTDTVICYFCHYGVWSNSPVATHHSRDDNFETNLETIRNSLPQKWTVVVLATNRTQSIESPLALYLTLTSIMVVSGRGSEEEGGGSACSTERKERV